MEESNLRLLILFGYTAGIIFALIVTIILIYNYLVKHTIVTGIITYGRTIIYNGHYYDYRYDNKEDWPKIDQLVKGYITKCHDGPMPYDIFVITELIKEPCTVD